MKYTAQYEAVQLPSFTVYGAVTKPTVGECLVAITAALTVDFGRSDPDCLNIIITKTVEEATDGE